MATEAIVVAMVGTEGEKLNRLREVVAGKTGGGVAAGEKLNHMSQLYDMYLTSVVLG